MVSRNSCASHSAQKRCSQPVSVPVLQRMATRMVPPSFRKSHRYSPVASSQKHSPWPSSTALCTANRKSVNADPASDPVTVACVPLCAIVPTTRPNESHFKLTSIRSPSVSQACISRLQGLAFWPAADFQAAPGTSANICKSTGRSGAGLAPIRQAEARRRPKGLVPRRNGLIR